MFGGVKPYEPDTDAKSVSTEGDDAPPPGIMDEDR